MTIKDYENILKENKIAVREFIVDQAYIIKTDLGVLHIDRYGRISSITGNDETRVKLCEMLDFAVERPKKRWQYKIEYLSERIKYLEDLLKANKINYGEE